MIDATTIIKPFQFIVKLATINIGKDETVRCIEMVKLNNLN